MADTNEVKVDQTAKHRRDVMRRELSKMAERESNERERRLARRRELEGEAKKILEGERLERGLTILPGAADSKMMVRKDAELEERLSLKNDQDKLRAESRRLQADIHRKLAVSDLPQGEQLVALAGEFYSNQRMPNQHLPPHVTKALTTEEINDFRLVFEMFDVRNKGYITSDDLRRVAGMLGLTAKRKVFKEMIESTTATKRGRVNFISFLDLVVKLQGDGDDPMEEVIKGFSLLDKGAKGYLTFSDIQAASEELGVPLSNRAIREMMSEADKSGSGTVSLDEFQTVLIKTGAFWPTGGKPV